ncbi:MAG: glutaredoxin 3 [Burkholderiales bacterium]|nr:glutaredoxin 3 [Burkholderiales bacterium]
MEGRRAAAGIRRLVSIESTSAASVEVRMYTTGVCPYCVQAERLLRAKGAQEIAMVRVDLEPERRAEMMSRTGRRTVPQIYIGETHVGGFDELVELDRAGKLVPMLRGG